MQFRSIRALFPVLALTLLGVGHVPAARAEPQELKDYVLLENPQPVGNGKKIVVEEFFWYGCPHCYHVEPNVRAWRRTLPRDVEFRREAPALNDAWQTLAKAHYALETMKLSDRIGPKLFAAIHDSRELHVNDQSALVGWLARHGVDRDKFSEVYGSFGVDNAVSRANQKAMAYRIDGVPTFVVDGKYLTSVSMTGDGENLIATLNYLIARERRDKR